MLIEKYSEKRPSIVAIMLKRFRSRGMFTQQVVAYGTGIHKTKICKYEGGKQLPSPRNLQNLLNFYRYHHCATEGEVNTLMYSYDLEVVARGYQNQVQMLTR